MDTRIQTSFIPKKPVDGGHSTKASGGILYLLGTVVFVVALIASGLVFGYQKYLEGQIAKMEADLAQARQNLEPELIAELSRADKRFIAAEEIIKNHQTLSELFNILESLTLQNVAFSSFGYKNDSAGMNFLLEGEARSYATVAYQAKVFAEDPRFVNPQFSELDLGEGGNVLFSVKSGIDGKAISYTELLDKTISEIPVATIEETGSQANATASASSTPATTTPASSSITP